MKKDKCIVCKKRRRKSEFFCGKCISLDIFIKIKAFRESDDFKCLKYGRPPNLSRLNYKGRLPTSY